MQKKEKLQVLLNDLLEKSPYTKENLMKNLFSVLERPAVEPVLGSDGWQGYGSYDKHLDISRILEHLAPQLDSIDEILEIHHLIGSWGDKDPLDERLCVLLTDVVYRMNIDDLFMLWEKIGVYGYSSHKSGKLIDSRIINELKARDEIKSLVVLVSYWKKCKFGSKSGKYFEGLIQEFLSVVSPTSPEIAEILSQGVPQGLMKIFTEASLRFKKKYHWLQ